jgi:hypothetical protein
MYGCRQSPQFTPYYHENNKEIFVFHNEQIGLYIFLEHILRGWILWTLPQPNFIKIICYIYIAYASAFLRKKINDIIIVI